LPTGNDRVHLNKVFCLILILPLMLLGKPLTNKLNRSHTPAGHSSLG
jgi:hypothetical protein